MDRKLKRFAAAVAAIHEAGVSPARWPRALRSVMTLLEVDKGALFDVRADPVELESVFGLGHDAAAQRIYAEHYFAIDPTRQAGLAKPPLQVFSSYAVFDEGFRARSEYFDFARRYGIGDMVGISTRIIDGRRYVMSLQGDADGPAFDEEAKQWMRMLGPHLHRARQVQARLEQAELARLELGAGLDSVASAAFIVDGAGRTRFRNEAAAQLRSLHPGVFRKRANLGFSDPRLNERFAAAVRQAARQGGQATVLGLAIDSDKAEIIVAPLQAGPAAASAEPLALVAIVRQAVDAEAIAWRLRALYRLSDTEARVAAAVAMGRTLEEIAAMNNVKEATLRSQLRAIFRKTGTERQADLVRLALVASPFRLRG